MAQKKSPNEQPAIETENLSVEESFERLDEIIKKLESDDITLEESFRLYSEGMELTLKANASIERVEKKVMELKADGSFEELDIKYEQ